MSEMRWSERFEAAMGSLAARGHRRPWVALFVTLVLTGLGTFFARDLSLNADLSNLLPRSFQSVQDLEKLRTRFGGMGNVVVAGIGAEPEQLKQFVDDMAPKLGGLSEIRFVNYQRPSQFFDQHALYYVDLPDLRIIQERIDARFAWEKEQANPLFVRLEEAPPPSLDFTDIEQKYTGGANQRLSGQGELYYLDPQERMVVMLLKAKGSSADLGYSKKVIAQVQDYLSQQDLSKYGPGFRTELTGTFKKKIDQQGVITGDLARASSLAIVLLLAYLAFHFRSALSVGLTMAPVAAGLMWTYGFVGVAYGQVNLLTGFLAAVLGGLGVEHGIHLLGRWSTLRSEGMTSEEAVREAFSHTGFSALISALVAALTFLSLSLSEFRAFHEFGVIAAVGMLVSVGSYLLILPAMLGLVSKWGWTPRLHQAQSGPMAVLARFLPRRYRAVSVVLGVALVALISQAYGVTFNYDSTKLDDVSLPSVRLDRRIDHILGYSATPVVVLTDKEGQEREVVTQLQARKEQYGKDSTIDFVGALEDLVPTQQEEKHALLQSIHKKLSRIDPEKVAKDTRDNLVRAVRMTQAEPFTREQLPVSLRRQFEPAAGQKGGVVLVYANVSLSDGVGTRRFTKEVRNLQLSDGSQVSAAGEALILADILDMVAKESPRILVAAVLSVFFAMWMTLGSLRNAVICMLPTLLTIAALVGLMSILGLQFNYLNIVVIPVLIGTTVDAGVHLIERLGEPGADFVTVYAETGRAITGGLLTSAIGFLALVFAKHPGLNSIGDLANLGFAVNMVVVLVGFPALLLLVDRWRNKHGATPTAPTGAETPHPAPES
ncbi:MMPL family transporter [Corallococcus sp. bb12-1]|uniref:efflux RND transporter permease subunit n=1 Tax=Corallococcus sp. bb12-1 TaxID=2996784 RepID=UPI002271CB96|nr:MMPL family transporter [Corallococcus sp. bb12-1]MCY1046629.1 MMPL family transporter [Corallococcus sp. bb12-1]